MPFPSKSNRLLANRIWSCLPIALLVAWILIILCMSSVPPVSRDALTHHLRVPRLYMEHGGMVELPDIKFSYYPMNLDLFYVAALFLGNDILPKYIHFAFALLTAGLLFTHLRERLDKGYAYFGAFFFLSLPLIVKLSITVYVDLGLAFFFTAAIVHLLRWAERGYAKKHLILAAVFCGLALGTKYNGLIGFMLLTGSVPFFLSRRGGEVDEGLYVVGASVTPSALRSILIFVGLALLTFSPWMVRNALWTGNPLYPLFNTAFNGEPVGNASTLAPFALRRMVYGERFWEILLIPLRIFLTGVDDNPQLFDGRLSPFLLLLPAVAMLHLPTDPLRRKREKLFLAYFVAGTILIVFFKHDMRVRYLVPALPPLVILSTMGLQDLLKLATKTRYLRRISHASIFALVSVSVLGFNLPYLYATWQKVEPMAYLTGDLTRDAYIEKYRPEYALYRYANAELDPEVKIEGLFLGNRGYYCKRRIAFDIPGFKRRLESVSDVNAFKESFAKAGITHLMINETLFLPWIGANLDKSAQERLADFLNLHTHTLLRTDNGMRLLAIDW